MTKAQEILNIIREAIESHPELGTTTATLYDPDKLQNKVSIGIMEEVEGGVRKRFQVTVDDHAY